VIKSLLFSGAPDAARANETHYRPVLGRRSLS